MRVPRFENSIKPPVVAASIDIAADTQQIAARIVAVKYQLAPHVAHLVCELARIGQEVAE